MNLRELVGKRVCRTTPIYTEGYGYGFGFGSMKKCLIISIVI